MVDICHRRLQLQVAATGDADHGAVLDGIVVQRNLARLLLAVADDQAAPTARCLCPACDEDRLGRRALGDECPLHCQGDSKALRMVKRRSRT